MNINNLFHMDNNLNGFYIGIDSGGTKCELLITNKEKKKLFEQSYKGVHYSVLGSEKYSSAVSKFIFNALKQSELSLSDCLGIALGVAGAREETDRTKLKKSFEEILKFRNILITTDAMTALYGAFEGEEGIILISGTGSVLYGYSSDKIIRVGGWGRIVGDEGSGYWIGRKALNFVAKEYDERKNKEETSMLSKELFSKFGIDRHNLNAKVFQKDFEIQNLAPVVIECGEKKCKLALKVVNEAVFDLLEHIRIFLRVSGRKTKIKMAFIGGIIENQNILSDELSSQILNLKIVQVVRKKYSPSFGAILLASGNSGIIKKL